MTIILGLESSCDETAAALVTADGRILAHRLATQGEAHRPYGGVVPELASREHLRNLMPVAREALGQADVATDELDAIAAAVIGGASLSGGVGTISGTMIGAFIIGILRNGLNMAGVSAFIQQIVIGAVVIGAVWIDQMRNRR